MSRQQYGLGVWEDRRPVHVVHHHGGQILLAAMLLVGVYVWSTSRLHPAAKTAPAPAPKVITRTVTSTVYVHPAISGTDLVLIFLVVAVAVVGGLSVYFNRKGS